MFLKVKALKMIQAQSFLKFVSAFMVLGSFFVPELAFAEKTISSVASSNEFTQAFAGILAVFVNLVVFLSVVMISWGGN